MLVTVEGTNPDLKSVLLNSHYDVVPVFPVSQSTVLSSTSLADEYRGDFFPCRNFGCMMHLPHTKMNMETFMLEDHRYIIHIQKFLFENCMVIWK